MNPTTEIDLEQWTADLDFERLSPAARLAKKLLINPIANFMPATITRALLRWGQSELAASNWKDPGGWRSMVISYEGKPKLLADKILVGGGTIPMALRNRRILAGRILARLIDHAHADCAHILCLGAGPGMIVMPAMAQAESDSRATLVDLSADAFEFGRAQAEQLGLSDRIRFIQADVRDVEKLLETPPDIVKMMGICEYLTDEQIVAIASAAANVMPDGAAIVYNTISRSHGTDRFFRRVFGLNMNHRSCQQLQDLMQQAGFGDFQAVAEPLGVYHVVLARKLPADKAATGH
ncbi:MAG: SAM-dependent methyltransferase [Phycisphaerae bacterium]